MAPDRSQTDRPARGVFISFEGVDGAGKSTQCALACERLASTGHEVVRLREPGGTRIGERIREILLDPDCEAMDATCELLLYEAARAQLVAQVVVPALEAGKIVVSDRFFDSTTAYQGFARGLGGDVVLRANRLACGPVAPDRTVLLDLDPASALGRAAAATAASGHGDRLELEGVSFQEQVRAGYARIALDEPDRVRVVDAAGSVEEVYERVRDALSGLLELPEAEGAHVSGAMPRGGGAHPNADATVAPSSLGQPAEAHSQEAPHAR